MSSGMSSGGALGAEIWAFKGQQIECFFKIFSIFCRETIHVMFFTMRCYVGASLQRASNKRSGQIRGKTGLQIFWYYNTIILEYYKTVLSNFPYVAMRGGCIRGGANSPWSLYQRQSMLHRALWKVHYHSAWWWL